MILRTNGPAKGLKNPTGTALALLLSLACAGNANGGDSSPADTPIPSATPRLEQLAQSQQLFEFDIAAQPLDRAILNFSTQTGLQALFASDRLAGKTSPGARGQMTAEEALRTILKGSGLDYRFEDDETVRLVDAAIGATENTALHLAPIYVEANKREAQEIQSIPGSVYALDGLEIREARAGGIEDIARRVPNTVVDARTNGDVIIFLRGNSTDSTSTDAGIGIYVDGAYNYIQGNNNNFPLFDVDQVNVMLGPQGSLFGRNAVGGAINIQTTDPHDEVEAELTGEFSSFGGRRQDLTLNTPVNDKISVRLAAFHNERDPLYFNTTNNRDEQGLSQRGIRVKAKVDPADDLEFVVTAERQNQDLPGVALTTADTIGSFDTSQDVIGRNSRDSWRHNVKAKWEIADWLDLRSVTSLHRPEGSSLVDGDSSATVNQSVTVDFDARQFSQEFLLGSPANQSGPLAWTAGATYFNDQIETIQNNNVLAGAFAGTAIETTVEGDIEAVAVFGEVSYDLSDDLVATGALRYSYEQKDISVRQAVFGPGAAVLTPAAPIDENDTYRRLKPTANLSYEWGQDKLAYVKVATGYKSGGVNFTAVANPADATFDPEDVISYEAGIRSQWLDGRMRLNGTVFHQRQQDLQLRTRDVGAGVNFFSNVGNAETNGVELLSEIEPVAGLRLYATYGYLRARFDNAAIQSGLNLVEVSGNLIPDVPKHTASFGMRYGQDISSSLYAYARIDHYLTRGGFADAENIFKLDNKNSTNLSVGLEGDHFTGRFFVDNVFDEEYFEFSPTAAGLGQRNDPRVVGVSVSARW